MFADLKVIVKRARKDAITFYYNFGEKIPIRYLIKNMSFFIQEYTQKSGVRPFGTSIIIIGSDENGPCLYRINPGGAYSKNYLCSFGENSIECLQFLEKRWNTNYTTKNSIDLGILCLKEISDIKTTSENIQMAFLSKNNEIKIFGGKRIQTNIEALFFPERIFEKIFAKLHS
jgi:20S proteasome subunit alpha 2